MRKTDTIMSIDGRPANGDDIYDFLSDLEKPIIGCVIQCTSTENPKHSEKNL